MSTHSQLNNGRKVQRKQVWVICGNSKNRKVRRGLAVEDAIMQNKQATQATKAHMEQSDWDKYM